MDQERQQAAFTLAAARRVAAATRYVEGLRRSRAPAFPQGGGSLEPDVRVVRVTSATPVSGRYPSRVQAFTASSGGWADLNAGQDSWLVDANGAALAVGRYGAQRLGDDGAGKPVFVSLGPVAGGGGGPLTVATVDPGSGDAAASWPGTTALDFDLAAGFAASAAGATVTVTLQAAGYGHAGAVTVGYQEWQGPKRLKPGAAADGTGYDWLEFKDTDVMAGTAYWRFKERAAVYPGKTLGVGYSELGIEYADTGAADGVQQGAFVLVQAEGGLGGGNPDLDFVAVLESLVDVQSTAYAVRDNAGVYTGLWKTITAGGLALTFSGGLLTGSAAATSGGSSKVLFDHYADVANASTTETDLYSDTVAANQLGTVGDKLVATYGGVFANNANAKQLRVYFAGTLIFDSTSQLQKQAFEVRVLVIRSGSTTARAVCSVFPLTTALSNGASNETDLTGLNFAGTNVLKITGQGGASNDVTAKLGTVAWQGAA